MKTVWDLNQQLEDKVRLRTQQLESANAQLKQMAYHDALTQLPNRARLKECLWQSLEALQEDASAQFALMFFGLRSLQAGERFLRPCSGGCPAGGGQPTAVGLPWPQRHPGPIRRG